jgi:hypothetical protein
VPGLEKKEVELSVFVDDNISRKSQGNNMHAHTKTKTKCLQSWSKSLQIQNIKAS